MNGTLDTDTIVAIATAAGIGGIGVVRLSGPNSHTIASKICTGALTPRHAHYREFSATNTSSKTKACIDKGIALYFPAPASFTGEDVIELQAHGGPIVLDLLVKEALTQGARIARPGEFSERAFLNDKIDLVQAEAILDLINSRSEQAARGALKSLQGDFSRHLQSLADQLVQLRVYVEAALDFPEEEIDFLNNKEVLNSLNNLNSTLLASVQQTRQGTLLKEGISVAIAGRPNAGKSSLLNALAGYESAIVTDIAGTTRDVLRESINLDGLEIHIVDTAGLRESADAIEQEGIRRAGLEFGKADLILFVRDASHSDDTGNTSNHDLKALWPEPVPAADVLQRTLLIHNKIDKLDPSHAHLTLNTSNSCAISASTGDGLSELRDLIKQRAGYHSDASSFTARRRHLDALQKASDLVANGLLQLKTQGAGELLAEDLRHAQNCLEEITGKVSSDALLGEIFSSFCIGK